MAFFNYNEIGGRSSATIMQEIKKVEEEKNQVATALTTVQNFQEALGSYGSGFVSIGNWIAAAGNCWGTPFDQGKIAGYGNIYNNYAANAGDIVAELSKIISELDEQLETLNEEYKEAVRREQACRLYRSEPILSGPKNKNTSSGKTLGCFLSGTKVITNEGYKDIDKIKVNDMVLSYNEETRINEYKKVLNLLVHPKEKEVLYTLTIDDKTVEATSEHRFYIISESGNEWLPIKDLKVGNVLINSNGDTIVINKITSRKIEETIYNIEVEDNHNYYVTESEILVHNKKADSLLQNMLY